MTVRPSSVDGPSCDSRIINVAGVTSIFRSSAQLMSEDLGQGPSAVRGRCGDLRLSRSRSLPQVVAIGVFRDLDGEKRPGLERASESLGDLGHLFRVANRLVAIEQFLVASSERFDFGPLAAQVLGSRGLAGRLGQLGQPVKGLQIGRVDRDKALQFPTFGFVITPARAEPGAEPVDLCRRSTRRPAGASGPAAPGRSGWMRSRA